MEISRLFVPEGTDPFSMFEYEQHRCLLTHHKKKGKDGQPLVLRDMTCEVPKHWSTNARNVLIDKYVRKAGVPTATVSNEGAAEREVPAWLMPRRPAEGSITGPEVSVKQVVHRIVGHWTYTGYVGGWFDGGDEADTERNAKAFYDELVYILLNQMAAPNSPQWFNTGLFWAYGITGPKQGQWYVNLPANTKLINTKTEKFPGGMSMENFSPVINDVATAGSWDEAKKILDTQVVESDSAYKRVQAHACFILSLSDTLRDVQNNSGILDFYTREGIIFKYGSGSGVNASNIRAEGEPLSGGGKSSGLMSWLKVADYSAGAIKSGGTCLAGRTLVYTATGPTPVAQLVGRDFVVISYDPPAGRFKAKRATAWLSGKKRVVRVTTDKGVFDTSWDHPFKLSTGEYVNAADLRAGQSLFACSVDEQHGHLRVHLKNGLKGKRFLHQLVAEDVMGYELSFPDAVVDHIDGDKWNCEPANLQVKSQGEHAARHAREQVGAGNHIFQTTSFSHAGVDNGMHASSDFWSSAEASTYRQQKSVELLERGAATEMQDMAATQRMLNLGYRLINAGYTIDTFEQYVKARRKVVGRIASVTQVRKSIEARFGTYANFVESLAKNNHRVVSVTALGEEPVYDVQVDCPTDDVRDASTGHNFVIWPHANPVGSGVVVHNTRRAAKMVCLDADHPDILKFVKVKTESEVAVASLVTGSKVLTDHCQKIMTSVSNAMADPLSKAGLPPTYEAVVKHPPVLKRIEDALNAGVPDNYIDKAIRLALEGEKEWIGGVYDTGYEDPAYELVPFQNANHSVRLTADFYKRIDDNADWSTTWRTNGQIAWTLPARQIEREIAHAAWVSGDPGVQYHTNINDWNVTPKDGVIRGSNPCCFVGDTFVDTSEGRIRIEDLAKMYDRGEALPRAFGWDLAAGRLALRQINAAWCAGWTKELVEVNTDKGLSFRCTPEHRFLLRDGTYVEARCLKPGTSLRKVPRSTNDRRSDRCLIGDASRGTANGQVYQSRWIWEELHGPIPDGMEVHHRNEDPTDDRASNLECRPSTDHRSYHSTGDKNPRFLNTEEGLLLETWEAIERAFGTVTPWRWNSYRQQNGLVGRVAAVTMRGDGGRIRGISWAEFTAWIEEARSLANDRVVSVTPISLDEAVPVYDIEVDGIHNFAIGQGGAMNTHTIVVSNSEHMRPDDSACNLASLRIMKFFNRAKQFLIEEFVHVIDLFQMVLDITVSMAQLPSRAVALNVYGFRDTGLGYADLGALQMALGLPYNSEEARALAGALTAMLHGQAHWTSARMAKHLGAYPRFWANKEDHLRVVKNHMAALGKGSFKGLTINPPVLDREALKRAVGNDLAKRMYDVAMEAFNTSYEIAEEHGYRNAEMTLLAPTGTISILMDCDTTGVEPMLGLLVYKTLAGGGTMIIEPALCVREALLKLGYDEKQVEGWLAGMKEQKNQYGMVDEKLAATYLRSQIKKTHHKVFDTSLGAYPIAWEAHVKMMAAVQPFLSGAISKTINMPMSSTIDDIARAYRMGNDLALKSLALYRDKSKLSQPLNLSQSVDGFDVRTARVSPWIDPDSRMKLGGVRQCGIDIACDLYPGHLYLKTSHYPDGKIGEIWATYTADQGLIQAMLTHCCKTANVALQFGVPLEAIVRSWQDSVFEPKGSVGGHENIKMCSSLMNLIAKLLDYHILKNTSLLEVKPKGSPLLHDGVKDTPAVGAIVDALRVNLTGDLCPVCGSGMVVPSGANCKKCQKCGHAGGCG